MKFTLSLSIVFVFSSLQSLLSQITFQGIIGGSAIEWCTSVLCTKDSGYLFCGTSEKNMNESNIFIAKLYANGDTSWIKQYGGNNVEFGYEIISTYDTCYFVAGITTSFGAGGMDILIAKIDSVGNVLWSNTYGGTSADYVRSIKLTQEGGLILCGGSTSFGNGGADVLLIKMDQNGIIQWAKTYGASGNDLGYYIQQIYDGGFIISGYTESFSNNTYYNDILICRLDSSGNLMWSNIYGGQKEDQGYDIVLTNDSAFALIGFSNSLYNQGSAAILMKIDSLGNVLFTKTYRDGLYNSGNGLQQLSDGSFLIAGSSTITYQFQSNNVARIIKTDMAGNPIWTKAYGSIIYSEAAWNAKQTLDNSFIFTGHTSGNSFGGWYDLYFFKTDSIGNSSCNYINSNIISNNVLMPKSAVSLVSSQAMILTTSASLTINQTLPFNVLCTSVNINELEYPSDFIEFYPNPSTGLFELFFKELFKKGQIIIYNCLGDRIEEIKFTNALRLTVDLSSCSPGSYIISIIADDRFIYKKVIVTAN